MHRWEIGTELKRNAWLDAFFGPEQSAHDYVHAHSMKVADLMSCQLIAVDEDTSLDRVINLMERHHIKRLPVLRKGKVIGIISRANLMRALASLHRSASKTHAMTRSFASGSSPTSKSRTGLTVLTSWCWYAGASSISAGRLVIHRSALL